MSGNNNGYIPSAQMVDRNDDFEVTEPGKRAKAFSSLTPATRGSSSHVVEVLSCPAPSGERKGRTGDEAIALAQTLAIPRSPRTPTFGGESAPGLIDPEDANLDETIEFEERYHRRKVLGTGGMGEVLLCRDERMGREVALKVIRPELANNAQLRARFLREAKVQGQLEHPEVVPVYDLGVGPGNQVFFTMKRVRGRTLEQLIDLLGDGDPDVAKELSRRKLLSLMSSVCLAVDFAHKRGVIHRDLKPANIMLGDFGEVYVLDWGIAKFLGQEDDPPATEQVPVRSPGSADRDGKSDRPSLRLSGGSAPLRGEERVETAIGEMYGTPGYMSPEQIDGLSEVDARSDVYGLGAILFELLSLEPLHYGETPEEVIDTTLSGLDGRPSRRAPDRELPPELDLVCQKATARDPAERYATARDLSEAIESYLDGARDLQLRRDMAQSHAERAEELLKDALSATGSREARAAAMREVGRALALDPTNASAVRSMVRLLTELPEEMPPKAREAMAKSTMESDKVAAFSAIAIYLGSAVLYGALILWLGLRDVLWAAVTITGFAMAALLSYLDSKATGTRYEYGVLVCSLIAIVGSSRMLGPLILVPTFALGNTMGFALTPRKKRRILFIVTGCLSFFLPPVLEWLGILQSSYRFEDGMMMVVPQMHELPPVPTLVAMISISLLTTIGAALFAGETRDAQAAAERKLHLYTWQLRQMLPVQSVEDDVDGAEDH